ncbi:MAG: cation diffusion facilitator family transporter [Candidatus Nanopelagicales bacterium]|nr:cation diffusion facilitator family transporter [Candidatus Nanopelagicales bacterium]MDZ4249569.1 cation diffusion facilitator family transporter [Candidatus Nanopelagicales bacterium]
MSGSGTTAAEPTWGMANLSKFALMSLLVGFAVLLLKLGAWWVTDSVGLLSDALESTVNIAAAAVALVALRTASRPPDAHHQFGHGKAEYLSALTEGVVIAVAATTIVISGIYRLANPQDVREIGIGLLIAVLASVLNAATAFVLLRAGKSHGSLALVADARHLMTDVLTTAGVLIAVLLVGLTGWQILDPLVALAVAVNILFVGFRLVKRSTSGLMDSALPEDDLDVIRGIVNGFRGPDVVIHGLQTRQSGRQRFISMHVLVPGAHTVSAGHDICENLEDMLRNALPSTTVQTHLEPIEDPRAWRDVHSGQHPLD